MIDAQSQLWKLLKSLRRYYAKCVFPPGKTLALHETFCSALWVRWVELAVLKVKFLRPAKTEAYENSRANIIQPPLRLGWSHTRQDQKREVLQGEHENRASKSSRLSVLLLYREIVSFKPEIKKGIKKPWLQLVSTIIVLLLSTQEHPEMRLLNWKQV